VKLTYALGKDRARLVVLASLSFMAPGSHLVANLHPVRHVPLLALQYEPGDLVLVSLVVETMLKQEEKPEVYIWNREEDQPSVAVLFRARDPDERLLEMLTAGVGNTFRAALPQFGCVEVIAHSKAVLDQDNVTQILTGADENGGTIVIDVHKKGGSFEELPLYRCVSHMLLRQALEI
jgi:hypothetical protein